MQFILCVSLCVLCGSLCNYVNYTEFHREDTESHRVFCVLYFLIAPKMQRHKNAKTQRCKVRYVNLSLRNEKLTNCNGLDVDSSLRSE